MIVAATAATASVKTQPQLHPRSPAVGAFVVGGLLAWRRNCCWQRCGSHSSGRAGSVSEFYTERRRLHSFRTTA
jgi:hypothetical protein